MPLDSNMILEKTLGVTLTQKWYSLDFLWGLLTDYMKWFKEWVIIKLTLLVAKISKNKIAFK